jgi:hypothetical protein
MEFPRVEDCRPEGAGIPLARLVWGRCANHGSAWLRYIWKSGAAPLGNLCGGQSRLALDDVIGYTAPVVRVLPRADRPWLVESSTGTETKEGDLAGTHVCTVGPRRPLGSGTRAHVSPHRYPRAAVVQQPTRVYQSVNASKMRSARPHGPPTRSDAPCHPVHVTPGHSISVARRWRRDGVGPSPTGREQAEMPSNLRSVAVRVGRDNHQNVGIGSTAPAVRVSVHCGGYGCRSACSWYANRPNRATPTGR